MLAASDARFTSIWGCCKVSIIFRGLMIVVTSLLARILP